MSKELNFHQSFINSDEFFVYQESYGEKAFEAYRSNSYRDWIDKTIPESGPAVSLTRDELNIMVRDRVYPYLAEMSGIFEAAHATAVKTNNGNNGDLYSIENERLLDDAVSAYSEKVVEASESAAAFIVNAVRQSRIEVANDTPMDAQSWQSMIARWHDEMNPTYRATELAKIISIYKDPASGDSIDETATVDEMYENEPVFRSVCDELIHDFNLGRYKDHKVGEFLDLASVDLNGKMSLIRPESGYRQDVIALYDNELTRQDVVNHYKSTRPDLIWNLLDEREQIERAVEIDFASSITVDQLAFQDVLINELRGKTVVMNDINTREDDGRINAPMDQVN